MSYIFLQEQGEESSVECFLDIPQSVRLSLTDMPNSAYWPDSEMESSQNSQSGMMSPLLMETPGEGLWKLSVGDSPAKIFPALGKGQALQVQEAGCGNIWHGLSMKFDHNSSSLKTHLCLWEEDLSQYSVILPQWGMMHDGVFWEQMISGVIRYARDAGYWPTPLKEEGPGGQQMKLTDAIAIAEGYRPRYYKLDGMEGRQVFTGKVNPDWAEWLMGLPVGWTNALTALEMPKFQQWQQQHSGF